MVLQHFYCKKPREFIKQQDHLLHTDSRLLCRGCGWFPPVYFSFEEYLFCVRQTMFRLQANSFNHPMNRIHSNIFVLNTGFIWAEISTNYHCSQLRVLGCPWARAQIVFSEFVTMYCYLHRDIIGTVMHWTRRIVAISSLCTSSIPQLAPSRTTDRIENDRDCTIQCHERSAWNSIWIAVATAGYD